MHSSLIAAACIAVALTAACDEKPKDDAAKPPPAQSELVDIDASVLGESIDPPAPAGDLKAEMERFTNMEACIADRQKLDPLIGDAVSAIGYDTMFRDACRMLEAAKDRTLETCNQIDASPVRQKCQSWVAMVTSVPDACPLEFEGLATHGRLASCVAVAARDVRLCGAEIRTPQRATCEAMILKDTGKCSALRPMQKRACEREVTRWREVLPSPLEGLEKLPAPKATLSLVDDADAGTDVDLTLDAVNGVVVVTRGDTLRIELGSLLESESMHFAASPQKRPRLGLILAIEPKATSIPRLEVVQPGQAAFVSPPAQCDCKITNAHIESKRGTPVTFKLDAKLTAGTRTQALTLDVTSWVRDVVPDTMNTTRAIPPHLPALPSMRRDGGQ